MFDVFTFLLPFRNFHPDEPVGFAVRSPAEAHQLGDRCVGVGEEPEPSQVTFRDDEIEEPPVRPRERLDVEPERV
jgi:hypothetical protein